MKNKVMIALVALLISAPMAVAGIAISDMVMQDGVMHNVNEEILTSDSPIVFYPKMEIPNAQWRVEIFDIFDEWADFSSELEISTKNCVFDPKKYDWVPRFNWMSRPQPTYNEELNREYFSCRAVVYSDEVIEELYFKLAILPDNPIIDDVNFEIEYDWDGPIPRLKTSKLDVKVSFGNTNILYLAHSNQIDKYHSSEKPRFFGTRIMGGVWIDKMDGCMDFETDRVDWGVCFTVHAINEYGLVSCCDTLNTIDFVKDPVLLDYINDYWNELSGIEDSTISSDDVTIENDIVSCSGNVSELAIYSMSGNIVMQYSQPKTVSISSLSKGVYLITYKTISNQIKTIKYLKT